MALVYKAHDVLLNRKVAVKVLRQQFVHDEEFIRRFRREGQSAAALSHPNVVSIYDVGQEEDIHYIVMEYVEGHNLNEIIIERAPLQIEEAVHIAQQICEALDHAHTNHIIHRDIKPHNILIGNNGRAKVTDFGIARAVTSSTITHTGSVVGSVHYFSPEHAKGVNTGEKSDLYSLGIVLYQMLTGQLPFFGESPISIALKHLQDDFVEPRVANSHIPQSVENIILKSMRKNPDERYLSAKKMIADLETCLQPQRLYEPKIVFNHVDELQETKIMPAIRSSQMFDTNPARMQQATGPIDQTTRFTETMNTVQLEDNELAKKTMNWKKPLIVVLVTLVFLAALIWGFFKLLDTLQTDDVQVPYVVGKTEKEAREAIAEKGLNVHDPVTYEPSKIVPLGVVMEQSKMSMKVKAGYFIELTISSGPELKELPNYVNGMKIATINALVELGIKESQLEFIEVNDDSEVGTILEQTPTPGSEINPDDVKITFTVSAGPETFDMPTLEGKKLADAKDILKAYGLILEEGNIKYEASYLFEKDEVISQDIMPNEKVVKGSKVSIVVSTGQPKDAKTYQFNVRISPANSGVASEVEIQYSDARGENVELAPITITSTVDIPVTLVLDPDTVAVVSVTRDGTFMDIKEIRYSDIKKGSTTGLEIPGNEIVPTEAPADTETNTNANPNSNSNGKPEHKTEGNDNNEQIEQSTEAWSEE